MPLHIVDYVPGARGCPTVLKGTVNRDWAWDGFEADIHALDIPDGYVFTAKHQVLDFDFWGLNLMASDAFLAVCRSFDLPVRAIPVEVVQSTGRRSAKSYFYLLWGAPVSVFDWERSEYTLAQDAPAGDPEDRDITDLESVARFVVDEAKVPAAAAFMSLDAGRNLLCTDAFADACREAGLVGVGFRELTGFTRTDFWG
ncbi:hypothetical protein G7070_06105 [Propioniciclava coleopterorum]|uniref:Immunity MXAN-0049 protein domain-containing protein n=1 Tax=Propioniciclava coleopterorum TaxID=2714937 RepID=A0A6G7Y527_9ACTN|nr:DUF1629 domain-containing protein [Propioniciclava coleopterorum]QIK71920.1 hypothetical protein G7070_06105 [Propioniciclava coleopterorum]